MTTSEKTETTQASRLMALFEGFAEAYGTYDSSVPNEEKGGKLEIKATASTRRDSVTLEKWESHLEGRRPLGIIPIRQDNTCLWGVVDVDQYSLDLAEIYEQVERRKLPLVLCRSKSGGAHLFLFLSEPAPAEVLQARLREMAVLLGYGSSEIFPKQKKVELDRGDLGSWLNMPYFGGDETDRYGVKKGGMAMSVAEFLSVAEAARQPASYLEKSQRLKPEKDPDFGDGPPCMQHLAASGFPEGTRNKGLFALGIFAKKKYGADWEEAIERWNRDYFDPPLSSAEVHGIIQSLGKKDYHYTCKDSPLVNHCNSVLCRTRRYGVGGEDDYPAITGMSYLDTDPPLWFVDVEDSRIELRTDDLQNYKSFHRVCMERLQRCYRMMKQDTWLSVVAVAMKEAQKIEAPPEVGVQGHFLELLEDFLTNRHRGEKIDDIWLGQPYYNPERHEHVFRLKDLQSFLESRKFLAYTRGQVTTKIRDLGGGHRFVNIKGRGVNIFYLPADAIDMVPEVDLPTIEGDRI